MNNIVINSGEIRLTINDDASRVIAFNPQDLAFVERFYGLVSEFETKEQEYKERSAKLAEDKILDAYGIPINMADSLALLKEICEYSKQKIDEVFGQGTSAAAFGNATTLDMFEQFFNGVTPYIQNARSEKVEKYVGNRQQRRAVMK